jgi:O-antigen/teichoic acid export membrane protein
VVVQATSFILLARILRPDGYGLLVAVGALVGLLTPFAGFGYGNVVVRHISLSLARHQTELRHSNLLILISLGPGLLVLGGAVGLLFPQDAIALVALLCLTELGLGAASQTYGSALLAYGERGKYAMVLAAGAGTRLLSAASLLALPDNWRTPVAWAAMQFAMMGLSFLLARQLLLTRMASAPISDAPGSASPGSWRDGILFSVGLATRTIYDDIDKVMLARLGSVESTAIYAAAYRAVQAAAAPSLATNAQMYPEFLRAGDRGAAAMRTLTLRGLRRTLALALIAGGGLFLLRDVLAQVLGPGYERVPDYVAMLAFLPLLQAVHFVLGDAITGMGRQGVRAGIQMATAAVSVGLNLWLIPVYGISGAVLATLGSELVLTVTLLLLWRATVRARGEQSPGDVRP